MIMMYRILLLHKMVAVEAIHSQENALNVVKKDIEHIIVRIEIIIITIIIITTEAVNQQKGSLKQQQQQRIR